MASVIRGSDNFDTAGGNAVKAWVNFNGTGTVAIRAAFNVSSITDNGTGDYTVNFTNALADANYSANVNAGGSAAVYLGSIYDLATARTASLLRVASLNTSNVSADAAVMNVSCFR